MFGKFKIQGNRVSIRTDEELADIDKNVADEAFKKYKKSILDEYLVSKGFIKYQKKAYVRKNRVDILEYIDIQKERYGSKTFTVNYSIMPLYVPHDCIVIGFGDRLGKIICGKDIWWDYADEGMASVSFQNVEEAIDRFVIPWFEKYSDERYLKKVLFKHKQEYEKKGLGIPYKNEEWINALDERDNRECIIYENYKKLKLPKNF